MRLVATRQINLLHPESFNMKSASLKLDPNGIPTWIGEICDNDHIGQFSDTRTFRLLLVIFRQLIGWGSALAEFDDRGRDVEIRAFDRWFIKSSDSLPASACIMWAHTEIGKKALVERIEDGSVDVRLAHIELAFRMLLDDWRTNSKTEKYCKVMRNAWMNREFEQYKESLHLGLLATLNAHAIHEMKALAKAMLIAESSVGQTVSERMQSANIEPRRKYRPMLK